MADNTVDIDSVSDFVSPDAYAALGNKAPTNKPDISCLPAVS